ncbi:hypothetical protein [Nocardioides bigeumensis]|uniref:Uncharacterized protein n=1 Tax=Nocardioides bigeumensis TaxID=433657 RepID=A0ABP5JS56_9ACTN
MSIDERIRAGLQGNATSYQPEVESSLDAVRGQRRHAWGRAGVAAGVAAAAVAVVAVLAWPGGPAPTRPTQAPPATSDLFGSYAAEVSSPARLAGRWVLELDGNGTVVVTPPDRYSGVVSGTLFTADSTTLRINLFAQDVCADLGNGEYTWAREDDRLILGADAEPCRTRLDFFTDNDWVASP